MNRSQKRAVMNSAITQDQEDYDIACDRAEQQLRAAIGELNKASDVLFKSKVKSVRLGGAEANALAKQAEGIIHAVDKLPGFIDGRGSLDPKDSLTKGATS